MTVQRLFLGGPWRGRRYSVESHADRYTVPLHAPAFFFSTADYLSDEPPTTVYTRMRTPDHKEWVFVAPDYTYDTPEWEAFDTIEWVERACATGEGWQRLAHPWFWRGRLKDEDDTHTRFGRSWLYLLGDPQMRGTVRQVIAEEMIDYAIADLEEVVYKEMRFALVEQFLPLCVVPECKDKARATFIVREHGRLAGRDWRRDDRVLLCPEHGLDILRAQGFYGPAEQFPEWLRPDLKLDPFDELDAALDLLFGDQALDLLFGDQIRYSHNRIIALTEKR